ncbi:hypothetical protein SAMN05421736_104197 [Evansella caseinilytica]|uniref:Uncharacterized protein n=1 Tax=Evansella caseinilytica TaxID=1503961 RepID=A0A1H3NT54_9BACI|nr:DUF5696 domain-containing protein [Evansella caseinilytica]SDY92091.1 hypothetical protein SAMN05421736_104197 [Evansella caseinilytica]
MSKVIRRMQLLTLFLVTIIVPGCSDNTVSDGISEKDITEIEMTQTVPLQASFTDSRLEGMKGIVENDQLQLFIDEETAGIAVHHKASGDIWYSNPPGREEDQIATGVNKDLLSSQMQLQFYNYFGQSSSINSYSDSVVHEQYQMEMIPNGLRVVYQFGKAERTSADLPLMLSKERFEELSGRLDKTGQRALLIAYTENSETEIYERNDSALQGLQLERAFAAFEDAGYTEEDLERDMTELNFTQETEDGRVFIAAIEYTLDEDSLLVKVPVSSIQYSAEYPVSRISFMRFFGAAGAEESGSLFVPDGSGALIDFNNGKTRHPAYQQSVYGSDLTLLSNDENRNEEIIRLPVFGLIRDEGKALLGIIEEGASVATINADISGRVNSYNYVYPSFDVMSKGEVTLQANQQERKLPRFQEEPVKTDLTVRYVFLNGDEATYQGMAKYYQDYLVRTNGLPKRRDARVTADSPFYLQLVGSISKQKYVAGVPYQALESLTTFEQAASIIKQMQERDIHHLKLSYSGWFNKGVHHRTPDKVKVDRTIGGDKGLLDFISFAEEQGISVYPELAVLRVHSDSGFNEKRDASRTLTGTPAAVYPVNLALDTRDQRQQPSYILSPRLVKQYTEAMLKDFVPYQTAGISLRDLADELNGDYRKNNQVDRFESEMISTDALQMIHDQELEIMANGGNAYALPYLTDIVDIPLSSSEFKLQDESIPFFQMVIRGYIDYTGAPYNLSTNISEREYILKMLEYGSYVNYQWIYEANDKLKDSKFNHLYSVNYEQWLDQASEIYHEVNDILKHVHHQPIIGHEKLDQGVYKTVYENGMFIIVNYNQEAVTVEGLTLEPKSYLTGGEG